MKTSKNRTKPKRLTLEYKSKGWTFKVIDVPGTINLDTGEKLIAGKTGLQLLSVLKNISQSISKIKNLPKAEVEIKFSKVA